jgi:Xaa-Pro aminopeptidase
MPQGFSKDEYPRRWQRLRALMKERNLDCVIAPDGGDDEPSDVMYLAGTGAEWVVFPYDGKVAVIGRNGDEGGENEAGVELRPDGRPPGSLTGNVQGGVYSSALISVLREKGLTRARIGVGSLSGVPRNEEGTVSYATLAPVVKAFPQATFESAADLMMRVRLVRSQEELAVMQKANAVAELGVRAMQETARPGLPLVALWLKMYQTMLEASGSPGGIAFDVSGQSRRRDGAGRVGRLGRYANAHAGPPAPGQVLRAGQVVNQEITARVMGYNMQVNHPICVGSPAPEGWQSAAEKGIDTFEKLLDFIRPGRTMKELNELFAKLSAFEKTDTNVVFHFGDGPRIGPNRREGKDLVIEEGWVFHSMKPQLPIPPNTGLQARANGLFVRFGDGVLVTANGARRIGKRAFGWAPVGI